MNALTHNSIELRDIEQFVYHEVRLLDERRFEDWMALFEDDGYYWAPAVPGQEDPINHVSLFYDDKATMATRIERLRHPRIHIQTPHSRTAHVVSNIMLDSADDENNTYDVTCSFLMMEYRPNHEQRLFGGSYSYHLALEGDDFKIVSKKANLINCDGRFPALAVPF